MATLLPSKDPLWGVQRLSTLVTPHLSCLCSLAHKNFIKNFIAPFDSHPKVIVSNPKSTEAMPYRKSSRGLICVKRECPNGNCEILNSGEIHSVKMECPTRNLLSESIVRISKIFSDFQWLWHPIDLVQCPRFLHKRILQILSPTLTIIQGHCLKPKIKSGVASKEGEEVGGGGGRGTKT